MTKKIKPSAEKEVYSVGQGKNKQEPAKSGLSSETEGLKKSVLEKVLKKFEEGSWRVFDIIKLAIDLAFQAKDEEFEKERNELEIQFNEAVRTIVVLKKELEQAKSAERKRIRKIIKFIEENIDYDINEEVIEKLKAEILEGD